MILPSVRWQLSEPTVGATVPCDASRMSAVTLQFHATDPEIVAMAAEWIQEFSLHAGLGMLFAHQAIAVKNGDFSKALQIVPSPDFIILGLHPLRLPNGADLYRLKGMNDDILVLQPGKQRDSGLELSRMIGISGSPEATRLWRRLADRARRSMRSGAVITNPAINQLGRLPSHRFTDGALQLQQSGVKMRNSGGGQLYRLTPDPAPNPLQDQDMIALATISSVVEKWMEAELLPTEFIEELKEYLARYKVVQRDDTVGDMAVTIFDVTRRLHDAFARHDEPFTPSPRETTYFLHLPTEEQANAAAAALAGRTISVTVIRDFPSSNESASTRHLVWRLSVTLPGLAPDPAHRQNETDLSSLAHVHDGAYAGWERPDVQGVSPILIPGVESQDLLDRSVSGPG
jgi:hypothetical protein